MLDNVVNQAIPVHRLQLLQLGRLNEAWKLKVLTVVLSSQAKADAIEADTPELRCKHM